MANHSTLSVGENYATLLPDRISGRMDDISRGFDPATSSPTNVVTNTIRWSSANDRWQKWNGTAWINLSNFQDTLLSKTDTTAQGVNSFVNFTAGAQLSANSLITGQILGHTGTVALNPYGRTEVVDAALDSRRWDVIHNATQKISNISNDSYSSSNSYDVVTRNGAQIVTRHLNQSSGRLLVGLGVVDNGISALQTPTLNVTNTITGAIDSNTTYCGQTLAVQGISCNTVTKPGAYIYNHGNAANTDAPPDSPNYGTFSVTSDKNATFTTQTISPHASASSKGWWTRTWLVAGVTNAVWRRFAMHAEDVVFKSVKVTEQPRLLFTANKNNLANELTISPSFSAGFLITNPTTISVQGVAKDCTLSIGQGFASIPGTGFLNEIMLLNVSLNGFTVAYYPVIFINSRVSYFSGSVIIPNTVAGDVIRFSTQSNASVSLTDCTLIKNIT